MKVNVVFAILLAVVLIATMATSAVSAGSSSSASPSQMWYLDSVDHLVAGKVMEKTDTQAGSVTIPASGEQIWLADEAAFCDVTITGGMWVVLLHVLTDIETGDFDAWIGSYCEGEGFEEIATWHLISIEILDWNKYLEIQFQSDPATIEEGCYLALKIENKDSEDHVISTETNEGLCHGGSWLRTPCGDPGYPSPELSGAIFLGVGLIGLGYLGIRRHKASEKA